MTMESTTDSREGAAALSFWCHMLRDASLMTTYPEKRLKYDREYVTRRVKNEGLSFLALTLPMLASAIERGFETGYFECPTSFEKRGEHLPRLLFCLFKEVYDEQSGRYNPECPWHIVKALRQLLRGFKKYDGPLDDAAIDGQVAQFVETDSSLKESDERRDRHTELLVSSARNIVTSVLASVPNTAFIGRPGPGACAKGTRHEQRFAPTARYLDIEKVFDTTDYYWNDYHFSDRLSEYLNLPVEDSGAAVLTVVPKSFGKGRLICMMPHEYMWFQQGIADQMRACFERNRFTRMSLPLNNQEVNRKRARQGSLPGSVQLATLDMKEASDRISLKLVEELFAGVPEWLACLKALSPRHIILPGNRHGGKMEPRMFAPMGSSLCFPVMSLVHFALVCAIASHTQRCTPAYAARQTTVYGDDIIVPSAWCPAIFEMLPLFGMKFNVDKSFTQGPFRESCGYDAFKGMNVAPTYVRRRELLRAVDDKDIKSVIDVEFSFRKGGWLTSALYLRNQLEKRLGVLPYVGPDSDVIGWKHDDLDFVRRSIRGTFRRSGDQSEMVRVRRFVNLPYASMVGCWERLIRYYSIGCGSATLSARYSQASIAWDTVVAHRLVAAKAPWVRSYEDYVGVSRF